MAQWTDESRYWHSVWEKNHLKTFYKNKWLSMKEECRRIRKRDKALRECRFVNCIYNNPIDRFCGMEESVVNE